MNKAMKVKFEKLAKKEGLLNTYKWLIEQGVKLDSPEFVAMELVERQADHYGWTKIASQCKLDLSNTLKQKVAEVALKS